jgi:hypothetical protein
VQNYKHDVEKRRELRFRKFMAPGSGGQSESQDGIQDTDNPADGGSGPDAEAQSFTKRFEGWFKSSDQMDPHGMGMFVRLFERREARKFGPVWHAWQVFVACIPSIIIIVVANSVQGLELPEEKLVSRDELVKYKQLKAMENSQRQEEGTARQKEDTGDAQVQDKSAIQVQETRATDVATSTPDANVGGDIAGVKAEVEALKAEIAGLKAWKEAQKQHDNAGKP